MSAHQDDGRFYFMMKHPGYKYIAGFEILKGVSALIVTFGILDIHHEPEFITHSQPHSFRHFIYEGIHKIQGLGPLQFHILFMFGLFYSGLRLLEGYGLWKELNWGRQIGIWSTVLYLPFEFVEIIQHFSFLKLGVTMVNLYIVAYLLRTKLNNKSPAISGGHKTIEDFR